MRSYEARLDRLEAVAAPEKPLFVVVMGDADAAEAIDTARRNNNWPDDGRHPVRLMYVRFVSPSPKE